MELDIQRGVPHQGVARPYSELIRKKQIYTRLLQKAKDEKKLALEQMKQFLIDGRLDTEDAEENFMQLLK